MSKIAVAALLAEFQTMLREHWAYDWRGAQRGKVSCAGAFVYAYKQHGISIDHGSNYMARSEVVQLIPIGQATVVPGMAAFKCRTPSDGKYDLPSKYRKGGASYNGDLNDYYHVGLVDEDTARILNAQSSSTGFVASPISQNWSHVAYLKRVDYGDDASTSIPGSSVSGQPTAPDPVGDTAVTVADSGKTVNLRSAPKPSASLVERVPLGEVVTVTERTSAEWWKVKWGKHAGYMMSKYLEPAPVGQGHDGTGETFSSYAVEFYDLTREQAMSLQSANKAYPSRVEGRNG